MFTPHSASTELRDVHQCSQPSHAPRHLRDKQGVTLPARASTSESTGATHPLNTPISVHGTSRNSVRTVHRCLLPFPICRTDLSRDTRRRLYRRGAPQSECGTGRRFSRGTYQAPSPETRRATRGLVPWAKSRRRCRYGARVPREDVERLLPGPSREGFLQLLTLPRRRQPSRRVSH